MDIIFKVSAPTLKVLLSKENLFQVSLGSTDSMGKLILGILLFLISLA